MTWYFRRSLALASDEANRLSQRELWPVHIFLGLFQNIETVASKTLGQLNISLETARKIVTECTLNLEKITDEQIANELETLKASDPILAETPTLLIVDANGVERKRYMPKFSSAFLGFMTQINQNVWQRREKYVGTELLLRSLMTYNDKALRQTLERLDLNEIKVSQAIETVRETTQEFKDMQA